MLYGYVMWTWEIWRKTYAEVIRERWTWLVKFHTQQFVTIGRVNLSTLPGNCLPLPHGDVSPPKTFLTPLHSNTAPIWGCREFLHPWWCVCYSQLGGYCSILQWSFRRTGTMGTLVSQVEIGVWVQAPAALLWGFGVWPRKKCEIVYEKSCNIVFLYPCYLSSSSVYCIKIYSWWILVQAPLWIRHWQ